MCVRGVFVTLLAVLLTCPPMAAWAAPEPRGKVPARADFLAGKLRRDPIYVTDHLARRIGPGEADRIRRAAARMPVRTYVMVTPHIANDPDEEFELHGRRIVALVHDRLRRDGAYVALDPYGNAIDARQYGGSDLPLRDARGEINYVLPYDASVATRFERFVDNVLSGEARQRYERATKAPRPKSSGQRSNRPGPHGESSGSSDDAALAGGVLTGSIVTALVIALIVWLRRRRTPGREAL